MKIKTGIDLLKSERFLGSLENGGETFRTRLFIPQELRQNTPEQLTSIFCIKESVIKALELKPDSWLLISTNRKENGKVECSVLIEELAKGLISLDTSVSHDGGWIIAVTIAVIDN